MKKILNFLKTDFSNTENFDICFEAVKKFSTFHSLNLSIIECIEDDIIKNIDSQYRQFTKKKNDYLQNKNDIFVSNNFVYDIVTVVDYLKKVFTPFLNKTSIYIKEDDEVISSSIKNNTITLVIRRNNLDYKMDISYNRKTKSESFFLINSNYYTFKVTTDLPKSLYIKDINILKGVKKELNLYNKIFPFQSSVKELESRINAGYEWKKLNDSDKYNDRGKHLLSCFNSGSITNYSSFSEKDFERNEKDILKLIKKYNSTIQNLVKKSVSSSSSR